MTSLLKQPVIFSMHSMLLSLQMFAHSGASKNRIFYGTLWTVRGQSVDNSTYLPNSTLSEMIEAA